MSAPYSNLPALRLPLGSSLTRRALLAALHACLFAVVLLALSRDAAGVAIVALTAHCLLSGVPRRRWFRTGPGAPTEISEDRQGQWRALTPQGRVLLLPRAQPTVLPLVAYLPFRRLPTGESMDVWVFRDAVGPERWRQLRVRLNVRWRTGGQR